METLTKENENVRVENISRHSNISNPHSGSSGSNDLSGSQSGQEEEVRKEDRQEDRKEDTPESSRKTRGRPKGSPNKKPGKTTSTTTAQNIQPLTENLGPGNPNYHKRRAERTAAERGNLTTTEGLVSTKTKKQQRLEATFNERMVVAKEVIPALVELSTRTIEGFLPPEFTQENKDTLSIVWEPVYASSTGDINPLHVALLTTAAILAPRVKAPAKSLVVRLWIWWKARKARKVARQE